MKKQEEKQDKLPTEKDGMQTGIHKIGKVNETQVKLIGVGEMIAV